MAATGSSRRYRWTHPSVLLMAQGGDPLGEMIRRARSLVFTAMQSGWSGPPFDPFALADCLSIPVVARENVLDARTVPLANGGLRVEYNPNRSKGRVRYSIAHELTHTLFPDCWQQVRQRKSKGQLREDDWQLEMLCNVGAAELIMPIGSFPQLRHQSLTIDNLLALREDYDVSVEALLLRAVKLTATVCFMFCASRQEHLRPSRRFSIDYSVPSPAAPAAPPPGSAIPKGSLVEECTAIGYTAKGPERWGRRIGEVHAECVGLPPYPGRQDPRVAGIAAFPQGKQRATERIRYLKGDATEPRGEGSRILAFIINDKALSWGAGFGKAVQGKWPFLREEFAHWARQSNSSFSLGEAHSSSIEPELVAFEMIAQHGYGPSRTPRIRYGALEASLRKLADEARRRHASVHMPRIGTGHAGGSWGIIRELVEDIVCSKGIPVTVYDLPGSRTEPRGEQRTLFDGRE
jgi:O-acetyl-ADP-ribose deacetylase (regulator of RNase III)